MTYPLPLGEGRVRAIRHHLALPSFRCFRISHALTPGPSPKGRGEFSNSLGGRPKLVHTIAQAADGVQSPFEPFSVFSRFCLVNFLEGAINKSWRLYR